MAALSIFASVGILLFLAYDWYRENRALMHQTRNRNATVTVRKVPWYIVHVGQYDFNIIPLPLAIILAYLFRTPLLSAYILIIGIMASMHFANRIKVAARASMTLQINQMVVGFRGIYKIRPSVFSALSEAVSKIDNPLKEYVQQAVQTFYITASTRRALDELRRRTQNPYMDQFVYILERTENARQDTVVNALDNLVHRLRYYQDLRSQTDVSLAVITGQTLIIEAMSIIIVLIIALIPNLREAYRESINGQIFFIFFATIGVLTVYYIERRIQTLKERVL
ncbi:MAG: hypothetical protein HY326_00955 [Chloroflexi bacterium]|nr:hypothetical protein [Chloroflexota bacterium]